jgi:hypothetical protein
MEQMRLESVRSLKEEILLQTLTRARAARVSLRDGVALRRSALPAVEPPPPIALGIEGSHGDYRLAIRIQTASPGVQKNVERILEAAHGEASVRVVGRVVKQAVTRGRVRPLQIGCSLSHSAMTAGTLGCFVQVDGQAEPCILSNNHVLADENRAPLGASVLQPGPFDGGTSPVDDVAVLSRFEPLNASGKNLVDAAVATLRRGISADFCALPGLGTLDGTRDEPLEGEEIVFKIGRTTGLTRGRVSAFEIDDVWVRYDLGVIGFDRQIEIAPLDGNPFSLGGDSGSVIVDAGMRAVGLLFAGNDVDVTYANPIQTVLQTLGARLL